MSIKLLTLLTLIANLTFAQVSSTLNVRLGNLDKLFLQKVSIIDTQTKKSVVLKDGTYAFKHGNQNADIFIKNGLINGNVSILKGEEKSEYKIENSQAKTFTVYTGGFLSLEGHRDAEKAYYKEYYLDPEQRLKSEGWMSLNKNKHYGIGISKRYYEDGTIAHIADRVTETFTDFYPNGNKKKKQGHNIYETFKEDGSVYNRQYTKNNIRYDDYYYEGKLSTRSYREGASEIEEYYQNGVLHKKESTQANGQVRVFTYDKAGKLISDQKSRSQYPGRINTN
ncbi:MAG: hypothetical protein LBF27_09040 [Sphingobacterium sp.]|jgi:hypothetical protein|nr:hypothetical protein [Sphingobacterium sp.]